MIAFGILLEVLMMFTHDLFFLILLYFLILQCKQRVAEPGDGIDNDCDGKVDEEIRDRLDNDGDGLIDEDTQLVTIYTINNCLKAKFLKWLSE